MSILIINVICKKLLINVHLLLVYFGFELFIELHLWRPSEWLSIVSYVIGKLRAWRAAQGGVENAFVRFDRAKSCALLEMSAVHWVLNDEHVASSK